MKNKGTRQQFIYGIHPLREALEHGKPIEKVLIQKGLRGPQTAELPKLLNHYRIPFQFVPIEKLRRTTAANHQGVVAWVSPVEYEEIENLIPWLFEKGEVPFIVALDQITDVRNFGAICRSAEAAGVHALVLPDKGSAQLNADAIKTSAGALLRLKLCRSSKLEDTMLFLRDSGLQIIAVSEKGQLPYYQANLRNPLVLIMGSEEHGIGSKLMGLSEAQLRIPMLGEMASLNVSVAAGILMFEVNRQRSADIHS